MVRQQNVKFGLGEHRHRRASNRTGLDWNLGTEESGVRKQPRYNPNPPPPANSVSLWRIDTVPAGASSSGAIIASAFLASRSRIIAFTGPRAVADSDSERYPSAIRASAPIGFDAISPQSEADFLTACAFRTISRSA